jgi:hypothetical protein
MSFMLIVSVLRSYVLPKLDGPLVAWLTVLASALAPMGYALATGADIVASLIQAGEGLMTGLVAVGLWQTTGKPIRDKVREGQ